MKHPLIANYTISVMLWKTCIYTRDIKSQPLPPTPLPRPPNSRWNRERLKTFQDMLRQKGTEPCNLTAGICFKHVQHTFGLKYYRISWKNCCSPKLAILGTRQSIKIHSQEFLCRETVSEEYIWDKKNATSSIRMLIISSTSSDQTGLRKIWKYA